MTNGQAVLNRRPLYSSDDGITKEEDTGEEFFAVTETSVYRVSSLTDSRNTPIVEKIALVGESDVPVGGRLKGGNLIGIMKIGIILYIEDHPRPGRPQRPEDVNTGYWGGHTSPIVALCLRQDDAMICLHSKDIKNCDPGWRRETEEVLEHIGDDHPVFILSVTEAITFE